MSECHAYSWERNAVFPSRLYTAYCSMAAEPGRSISSAVTSDGTVGHFTFDLTFAEPIR